MIKNSVVTLLQKDCFAVLADLADGSVDLILSDPPYYSTNLHFDKQPRIDFQLWLKECKRVLKPNGVLLSFCDLNLLIELRSHKVFKSCYELVWSKNRGPNFMDVNFRPFRTHEYILVFTNQFKKSTYNPQRVAVSESSLTRHKLGKIVIKRNKTSPVALYSGVKKPAIRQYVNDGKRHPFSVLSYAVPQGKNNTAHPTQKPLDLCEWLIKTYSNEGDLVVDTFAGSGTTLVACVNLNRNGIGCELHEAYVEIAKNQIENAKIKLLEAENSETNELYELIL